MNKVSIIIPTYKRPERLFNAIQSVLRQTYLNFEVLVIDDDPSSNDAAYVATSFHDSRIFYYRNFRLKGGNGARNCGVLKASGSFLSFLDDDDEYMPERIEKLMYMLANSTCNVACSAYYLKAKTLKMRRIRHAFTLENFLKGKLFLAAGSNLIIRNNKHVSHLLWDEKLPRHQDTEYVIRLISKWRFSYADEPLLIVNGHNGIPSAKVNMQAKVALIDSISAFLNDVDPNIRNFYLAKLYRDLSLAFEKEHDFRRMLAYLKLSLSYKILPPQKYLRFLFSFL